MNKSHLLDKSVVLSWDKKDLQIMLMRRCLNNEMVEEYVVNEIRLEKFPKLRKHFDRFKGKDTARYSREEIFVLMDGLEPQGDNMLQELYETGMLEAKGG